MSARHALPTVQGTVEHGYCARTRQFVLSILNHREQFHPFDYLVSPRKRRHRETLGLIGLGTSGVRSMRGIMSLKWAEKFPKSEVLRLIVGRSEGQVSDGCYRETYSLPLSSVIPIPSDFPPMVPSFKQRVPRQRSGEVAPRCSSSTTRREASLQTYLYENRVLIPTIFLTPVHARQGEYDMSIRRTCAYILMAGGILFFGTSITQAGGSQSGSTMGSQSGTGSGTGSGSVGSPSTGTPGTGSLGNPGAPGTGQGGMGMPGTGSSGSMGTPGTGSGKTGAPGTGSGTMGTPGTGSSGSMGTPGTGSGSMGVPGTGSGTMGTPGGTSSGGTGSSGGGGGR
jgi:hypothetical protein